MTPWLGLACHTAYWPLEIHSGTQRNIFYCPKKYILSCSNNPPATRKYILIFKWNTFHCAQIDTFMQLSKDAMHCFELHFTFGLHCIALALVGISLSTNFWTFRAFSTLIVVVDSRLNGSRDEIIHHHSLALLPMQKHKCKTETSGFIGRFIGSLGW